MGIRATVVGELARIEQTSNGSTLFDVCVRTKSGPVNIVGFSSDTNAGKAFKAGNLVCMQGNAAFREFNDETSFQMSRVSVSRVKEASPYVQIEADGRLTRAVVAECDDGTELYKLQIAIRTTVRRDPKDPRVDPEDKSTHWEKTDVPLFAICAGPAFTQAETLVEEEASRVTLSGYLEVMEPLWVAGCDFPCVQMVCLKAVAGAASTGDDWWSKKPKKPSITALKEPVLINTGPNDELPF